MPPSSHRSLADHDPEKRSKTPEDVDGATPATTIKGGDQDDDATRRQEQLEDGPLEKVNEPPIDPPAGHAAQSFPDGGLQGRSENSESFLPQSHLGDLPFPFPLFLSLNGG